MDPRDGITEKEDFEAQESKSVPNNQHDVNIYTYHETNAGRLVLDPEYASESLVLISFERSDHTSSKAKVEFGPEIASKLKLTKDGSKVLWPQPTDDPNDPQNVCDRYSASLGEQESCLLIHHS
jgi:hypothetical protein